MSENLILNCYLHSKLTGKCSDRHFFTKKVWILCSPWSSILRPPKHRFVFLLSILNPEAVISLCFVCVSCSLLLTKSHYQTKPPYLKNGSFHCFKPLSLQICAKIINNVGVFKAKLTASFSVARLSDFTPNVLYSIMFRIAFLLKCRRCDVPRWSWKASLLYIFSQKCS